MASQAAIAIENARLQTETRHGRGAVHYQRHVDRALVGQQPDELLSVVDTQLPSVTDAQVIYVALYDRASDALSFPLACVGASTTPVELARACSARMSSTILRRQRRCCWPVTVWTRPGATWASRRSCRRRAASLGVPLFAGYEVIGVLAVRDDADPRLQPQRPAHLDHGGRSIASLSRAPACSSRRSSWAAADQRACASAPPSWKKNGTTSARSTRSRPSWRPAWTWSACSTALEMVAEAVGATQGAISAIDPASDLLHFRARLGWPEQAAGAAPSRLPCA